MLAKLPPAEAYRRVALDARIAGARPAELVLVCYEQLTDALSLAIEADSRGDSLRRSAAMTRALAALAALQMGLDRNSPLAGVLDSFFQGVRHTLLKSVPDFDRTLIMGARTDLLDVARGLALADKTPI